MRRVKLLLGKNKPIFQMTASRQIQCNPFFLLICLGFLSLTFFCFHQAAHRRMKVSIRENDCVNITTVKTKKTPERN